MVSSSSSDEEEQQAQQAQQEQQRLEEEKQRQEEEERARLLKEQEQQSEKQDEDQRARAQEERARLLEEQEREKQEQEERARNVWQMNPLKTQAPPKKKRGERKEGEFLTTYRAIHELLQKYAPWLNLPNLPPPTQNNANKDQVKALNEAKALPKSKLFELAKRGQIISEDTTFEQFKEYLKVSTNSNCFF